MVDESKLRRELKEAGYALRKSRGPVSGNDLGGYMIVDVAGNYVVAGAKYDLTLDDVAEWLKETNG